MKLREPANCCGCSACAAVCPKGAISMAPDDKGFHYPVIDESKCVNCGLCEKVCPFHENYLRAQGLLEQSRYFALVHKDERSRRTSRSGGAFRAMAEAVIQSGGVVYGVALDADFRAYTKRVESLPELVLLQGSKYVQSDKENAFVQVRQDLAAGREVLYSGTGCECAGLISYLNAVKANMDRLTTCDIVCHGVPSPVIWQENVRKMEKRLHGKLESVSFRDKIFGWFPHIESYQRGGKTVYANEYTCLFYSHYILRESCGNCHFCNYERCADVTIADFWGCEKLQLPIDSRKGVSALMIHTGRGERMLERIRDRVDLFETEKSFTYQPNLERPSKLSGKYAQFWEDYHRMGYDGVCRKYYPMIERVKLLYNYLVRRKRR